MEVNIPLHDLLLTCYMAGGGRGPVRRGMNVQSASTRFHPLLLTSTRRRTMTTQKGQNYILYRVHIVHTEKYREFLYFF